jgi:thioredoxin reductase (NADPH)
MKTDYDVVVIGSGVAGITASIYLKRANINFCLIEKEAPGGQINKSSIIENYPGFTSITGPELAMKFYEQITNLKVKQKFEDVLEIIDKETYKIVKTNRSEITTKKIILALGRSPKRLENSKFLEGKGVSFCSLCDGNLYKGEEVAIIGGGNSALEEAIYLSGICKKITILARNNKLRGSKILQDRIKLQKNIEVSYDSQVSEFNEKDGVLESLLINKDSKEETLKVKACFIFIGYEPATNNFKPLEILDEKGYIIVDERNETPVKGIFAAGDVIQKEAYQIITASSDGVLAAVSCIKDIYSEVD